MSKNRPRVGGLFWVVLIVHCLGVSFMSKNRPQGRGTILGGSHCPLLRSVVHVLEQTAG